MVLEKTLLDESERDKSEHQKVIFNQNTIFLFKHFKSLNKTATFPDKQRLREETASNVHENVMLFNRYFQSVDFLNSTAKSEVLNSKESTFTIFTNRRKVSGWFLRMQILPKLRDLNRYLRVFSKVD